MSHFDGIIIDCSCSSQDIACVFVIDGLTINCCRSFTHSSYSISLHYESYLLRTFSIIKGEANPFLIK